VYWPRFDLTRLIMFEERWHGAILPPLLVARPGTLEHDAQA
jgi:hypothetical protein